MCRFCETLYRLHIERVRRALKEQIVHKLVLIINTYADRDVNTDAHEPSGHSLTVVCVCV